MRCMLKRRKSEVLHLKRKYKGIGEGGEKELKRGQK